MGSFYEASMTLIPKPDESFQSQKMKLYLNSICDRIGKPLNKIKGVTQSIYFQKARMIPQKEIYQCNKTHSWSKGQTSCLTQ